MGELTRQAIPLATSIVTLWMFWLAGSKKVKAWVVGLANQVLWVAFIIVFEAWGLIPLTAALTVIYTRNLLRWNREEAETVTVAVCNHKSWGRFCAKPEGHEGEHESCGGHRWAEETEGYLDVVFDGPPGYESGRFIEVETPVGSSVSAGKWIQRPDGYWVLRLNHESITDAVTAGLKVESMRPVAYEGRADCTSMLCRRFQGSDEPGCIGWHCSICDKPSNQYGHKECQEKVRG